VLERQHVRAVAELLHQAARIFTARVILDQIEECVAELRGCHAIEIVARMLGPSVLPEIRVAVDTDVEAIARIFAQATTYWTGLDPEVFVEVDPERFAEHYRAGKQFPSDVPTADRCTLVAEIDAIVVGFVDVTISRPASEVDIHRPDVRGWVQEIAVAENLRGHGIGAVLLSAAEAWARDRGAVWILLDTHPANVEALHFYQARMGYAPVGVRLTKRL
jgi:ribosomal protein S18 acetylase RimI-like enzyme